MEAVGTGTTLLVEQEVVLALVEVAAPVVAGQVYTVVE